MLQAQSHMGYNETAQNENCLSGFLSIDKKNVDHIKNKDRVLNLFHVNSYENKYVFKTTQLLFYTCINLLS